MLSTQSVDKMSISSLYPQKVTHDCCHLFLLSIHASSSVSSDVFHLFPLLPSLYCIQHILRYHNILTTDHYTASGNLENFMPRLHPYSTFSQPLFLTVLPRVKVPLLKISHIPRAQSWKIVPCPCVCSQVIPTNTSPSPESMDSFSGFVNKNLYSCWFHISLQLAPTHSDVFFH